MDIHEYERGRRDERAQLALLLRGAIAAYKGDPRARALPVLRDLLRDVEGDMRAVTGEDSASTPQPNSAR